MSRLLTALQRSGHEERGTRIASAKVGSTVKQTLGRIQLLLQGDLASTPSWMLYLSRPSVAMGEVRICTLQDNLSSICLFLNSLLQHEVYFGLL